jgi:hypothetical protein
MSEPGSECRTDTDRITELEQEVRALKARLARLECPPRPARSIRPEGSGMYPHRL